MKAILEGSLASAVAAAAANADAVDRNGRFPAEAMAELKRAGLMGALIPRSLGGAGLTMAEVASSCHALGTACGSAAMVFAMHQIQIACLAVHGQHETWVRAFLQRVADQQLLIASVTSEEGTGGNIRMSRCAVQGTGSVFTLEKRATTISYGAYADALLVTARRAEDAASSDQVAIVGMADDYVLERRGEWDTLGMRGTCSEAFVVRLAADRQQILQTPYATVAETMLTVSHLLWGSVWLGIATDAVQRARAALRADLRRRHGEAPPGTRRLATAVGLLQSMQATLAKALAHYDRMAASGTAPGPGSVVDMNLLKVELSELGVLVALEALAITGISGYRNGTEFSLGRQLRDLLSAPLMIGNDRIRDNTANLLLMQMPRMGQFEL
jgi:acyl-CoA dehydrogenase